MLLLCLLLLVSRFGLNSQTRKLSKGVGSTCDPRDKFKFPHHNDSQQYFTCNSNGRYELHSCNATQRFDFATQTCATDMERSMEPETDIQFDMQGCPLNQIPYMDNASNLPRSCSATNSCPVGFGCVRSETLQRYICCGRDFGCPANSAGFVDPANGREVDCSIGSGCAAGFTCQRSPTLGKDICCSDTSTTVQPRQKVLCPDGEVALMSGSVVHECSSMVPCPSKHECLLVDTGQHVCCPAASQSSSMCMDGSFPYVVPGSTTYYQCTPSMFQSCPVQGYRCSQLTNGLYGCCSDGTAVVDPICPVGQVAMIGFDSKPKRCQPSQNSIFQCGLGYECDQAANQPNVFLCCSQPTNANICPDGLTVEFQPQSSIPRTCVPNTPNACTAGYVCMLGTRNKYVCCMADPQCPAGMEPFFVQGTINQLQVCALIGSSADCPANYMCANAHGVKIGVCCRTGTTNFGNQCPNGALPYTVPGTATPQACLPGNTIASCPLGYTCQGSTTRPGRYICCAEQATCPYGDEPYRPPGATRPVPCRPTQSPMQPSGCPAGYDCIRPKTAPDFMCCRDVAECPGNMVVYRNPQTLVKQSCSGGYDSSCPAGYQCVMSSGIATDQHLCCSEQSQTQCASGLQPYIDYRTGSRQFCQPMQATCPVGTICAASNVQGQFLCCIATPGPPNVGNALCPYGYPYVVPGTQQRQSCSPSGGPTTCPTGFACAQAVNLPGQYICCGGDTQQTGSCPAGATAAVDRNTGTAVKCVPQASSCPMNYYCQPSSYPGLYICCTAADNRNLACPSGYTPYIMPGARAPMQCSPYGNQCPAGYSCTNSINTPGQMICCGADTPDRSCPQDKQPFMLTNTAMECQPNYLSCPYGYTCDFSPDKQKYYCCGTGVYSGSGGCPAGSHVLTRPDNSVELCNGVGSHECPSHYLCTYSDVYSRWQCCSSRLIWRKDPKVSKTNGTVEVNNTLDNTSYAHHLLDVDANGEHKDPGYDCGDDHILLKGRCLKTFYPGQKGCTSDVQCETVTPSAKCAYGSCVCPRNKLVLANECVSYCPSGFANVAGKCNPVAALSKARRFKDYVAVESNNLSLQNGTVGGWCNQSPDPAQKCKPRNSICDSELLICKCHDGFVYRRGNCVLL